MASVSLLVPSDRQIIDDLPSRFGTLPGEVDLLCQYLADALEEVLGECDLHANGKEIVE